MSVCRLTECISMKYSLLKKELFFYKTMFLNLQLLYSRVKSFFSFFHICFPWSRRDLHATSWSGVRRATIAPRNLIWSLTIHFLILHSYPRWNHVSMKCKILIVINLFLNTSASKCKHRWFSGRMLACHVGGPGSIPGRCILALLKHVFR